MTVAKAYSHNLAPLENFIGRNLPAAAVADAGDFCLEFNLAQLGTDHGASFLPL